MTSLYASLRFPVIPCANRMKFARNWLPVDLDQEKSPTPLVPRLWRESPRSEQNKGADQQTCSKGAEPEGADGNDAQEDAKPPLKFIVCHLADMSRHWCCPARALLGTPDLNSKSWSSRGIGSGRDAVIEN